MAQEGSYPSGFPGYAGNHGEYGNDVGPGSIVYGDTPFSSGYENLSGEMHNEQWYGSNFNPEATGQSQNVANTHGHLNHTFHAPNHNVGQHGHYAEPQFYSNSSGFQEHPVSQAYSNQPHNTAATQAAPYNGADFSSAVYGHNPAHSYAGTQQHSQFTEQQPQFAGHHQSYPVQQGQQDHPGASQEDFSRIDTGNGQPSHQASTQFSQFSNNYGHNALGYGAHQPEQQVQPQRVLTPSQAQQVHSVPSGIGQQQPQQVQQVQQVQHQTMPSQIAHPIARTQDGLKSSVSITQNAGQGMPRTGEQAQNSSMPSTLSAPASSGVAGLTKTESPVSSSSEHSQIGATRAPPPSKRAKPTIRAPTSRSASPAVAPLGISQAPTARKVSESRISALPAGFGATSTAAVAAAPAQNGSTQSLKDASKQSIPAPAAVPGFKSIPGASNLLISVSSVRQRGEAAKKKNSTTYQYVAAYNRFDAPLLPGIRVPGEVRRDWLACSNWVDSPHVIGKTSSVLKEELARLNNEMFKLTGARLASESFKTRKAKTKARMESDDQATGSPWNTLASESESEDDVVSAEDLKAREIKSKPRPKDPSKATEYDVITIVWRDPNDIPEDGFAGRAIHQFGAVVEKLWGAIKALRDRIKNTPHKKDDLQKQMDVQKDILRVAIQTAITYGYDSVLENMSGNGKLVVILTNMLRWAYSCKNYTGELPLAILDLMAQFRTLEQKTVTGCKIDQIQPKYAEHLDARSIDLLEEIIGNVKDAEKSADAKDGGKSGKLASQTIPRDAAAASPSISKKPAGGIFAAAAKPVDASALKKTASGSSMVSSSGAGSAALKDSTPAASLRKTPMQMSLMAASKKKTTAPMDTSGGLLGQTGSPAKRPRDDEVDFRALKKAAVESTSKTSIMTAATSSTAASGSSTNKSRPSSTGLLLSNRNNRVTKKKTSEPPSSSAPEEPSNIRGLLNSIHSSDPKPSTPAAPMVPKIDKKPETEEEKKRRLRKESRRHLRVQFKPDSELEEVRLFSHDAAEDERSEQDMTDARDNASEGRAFKSNAQKIKVLDQQGMGDSADLGVAGDGDADMEDAPENDENESRSGMQPRAVSLRPGPWDNNGLSPVDFSSIDPRHRARTFFKVGGNKEPNTTNQYLMRNYERVRIMAVYGSLSDIPATPKSPPRDNTKYADEPHIGTNKALPGLPIHEEYKQRALDKARSGAMRAASYAIARWRPELTPPGPFNRQAYLPIDTVMYEYYKFSPDAKDLPPPPPKPEGCAEMTRAEKDEIVYKVLLIGAAQNKNKPQPPLPANPLPKKHHEHPDPKVAASMNAFEDVAERFACKPPAKEPPQWMQERQPELAKQWQDGYNIDHAAKTKPQPTASPVQSTHAMNIPAYGVSQQQSPQAAPAPQSNDSQVLNENEIRWLAYFSQYMAPEQALLQLRVMYPRAPQAQQQQHGAQEPAQPHASAGYGQHQHQPQSQATWSQVQPQVQAAQQQTANQQWSPEVAAVLMRLQASQQPEDQAAAPQPTPPAIQAYGYQPVAQPVAQPAMQAYQQPYPYYQQPVQPQARELTNEEKMEAVRTALLNSTLGGITPGAQQQPAPATPQTTAPAAQPFKQEEQPYQPPPSRHHSDRDYHHASSHGHGRNAAHSNNNPNNIMLDYDDLDYGDSGPPSTTNANTASGPAHNPGNNPGAHSHKSKKRKNQDNHGGRPDRKNKQPFHGKGSKPCHFFAQNKCAKGDKCNYRHDVNDLK